MVAGGREARRSSKMSFPGASTRLQTPPGGVHRSWLSRTHLARRSSKSDPTEPSASRRWRFPGVSSNQASGNGLREVIHCRHEAMQHRRWL
jgi:hypothetical protein